MKKLNSIILSSIAPINKNDLWLDIKSKVLRVFDSGGWNKIQTTEGRCLNNNEATTRKCIHSNGIIDSRVNGYWLVSNTRKYMPITNPRVGDYNYVYIKNTDTERLTEVHSIRYQDLKDYGIVEIPKYIDLSKYRLKVTVINGRPDTFISAKYFNNKVVIESYTKVPDKDGDDTLVLSIKIQYLLMHPINNESSMPYIFNVKNGIVTQVKESDMNGRWQLHSNGNIVIFDSDGQLRSGSSSTSVVYYRNKGCNKNLLDLSAKRSFNAGYPKTTNKYKYCYYVAYKDTLTKYRQCNQLPIISGFASIYSLKNEARYKVRVK